MQRIHEAEIAEFEAKKRKKLEKDEKELKAKIKNQERARKRSEKAKANLQKAAEKAGKAKAKFDVELKKREAGKVQIEQIQKDIAAGISTRPDKLTPAQKRKADQDTSTLSARSVSAGLPRSHMSLPELVSLCLERKLSKTGSKAQLQHRLEKEAKGATHELLRKRLEEYNASTEGSKEDLVARLAQADEANSMWDRNYDGSGYARPRKRQRKTFSKATVDESDDENVPSLICKHKDTIDLESVQDSSRIDTGI